MSEITIRALFEDFLFIYFNNKINSKLKSQKVKETKIIKMWNTEQLSDERIAKLIGLFTRVRQVIVYSESSIVSVVFNSVILGTALKRAEILGFKAELIGTYKGNIAIDFSFEVEQ